jgi:hypothetical protein
LQKRHQPVTELKAINQLWIYRCPCRDVTIPPERINGLAMGYTAPYIDSILSATALEQYESISQHLSRKWDGDPAMHAQLWEWHGCLEKLATSILQIERLSSISEGLGTYFQVHRLSQDQDHVLLYDMESQGVPFFKTAHEMGKNLSFVILNVLALFTTGKNFCLDHYNPNWKNRSVLVSNFVNMSLEQIRIPLVSKMTLSGFQYTERDVDEAIMANTISFTIAFSKKVKDLGKNGWTEVGKLSNGKILLVK